MIYGAPNTEDEVHGSNLLDLLLYFTSGPLTRRSRPPDAKRFFNVSQRAGVPLSSFAPHRLQAFSAPTSTNVATLPAAAYFTTNGEGPSARIRVTSSAASSPNNTTKAAPTNKRLLNVNHHTTSRRAHSPRRHKQASSKATAGAKYPKKRRRSSSQKFNPAKNASLPL